MSKSTNNNSPEQPTDQQRIRSLEARLDTVETQLLSCLTYIRYAAEKEAQRVAPLKAAPVKGIPKA